MISEMQGEVNRMQNECVMLLNTFNYVYNEDNLVEFMSKQTEVRKTKNYS
jgi:hypothetical protein